MHSRLISEILPSPWASFFPQSLLAVQDQTALVLTNSLEEKDRASDIEIASHIFRAVVQENPQLRSVIVVEGSLVHAFREGLLTVHKVS